jgi:hypothetical protein
MKKGILFLIMLSAFTSNAQSLKDLLYSGKLKMDSNSVIRKTDDLNSKIDTATKKPAEVEKPKLVASADSGRKANTTTTAPVAADNTDSASAGTTVGTTATTEVVSAAKSNTKIWKDYTDSLVSTLKTEVLSSKKIKKDTYYLYVDYEIGVDGQVNVTNVLATPENSFLQDQVKERMLYSVPQLTPVLDSNNKPRKVKRKYNFNITKE